MKIPYSFKCIILESKLEIQRNTFKNKLPKLIFWGNTKQWPLAPNSRKWRITCGNVSNASHIVLEMTFGECRRVWRVRHSILANLANFKARSFYVQKKIFLGIKRSSLSSPNSLNLLNTRQICQSESQKFGEFLAST